MNKLEVGCKAIFIAGLNAGKIVEVLYFDDFTNKFAFGRNWREGDVAVKSLGSPLIHPNGHKVMEGPTLSSRLRPLPKLKIKDEIMEMSK